MAHKFLVIGLGSMGKRRIRNLLALKVPKAQIYGFDPNAKRGVEVEKTYGIQTDTDFKRAVRDSKATAFVISTPPDKHAPYFLYAAKRGIHFFVEVTTVDDGYAKLMPLLNKKFVAAPSCTFRYVPAVQLIQKLVGKGEIGRPLYFRHYLGQYLPDWHPYEDYRKVYFAQKKTGGAREMFPYELNWLNFVFGSEIKKIAGINAKISDLDMTADDIYAGLVEYKNGVVGSVHVDLLNRKAARTFEIVGTKGTLEWDWLANQLVLYKRGSKPKRFNLKLSKKLAHYNTTENIYIAEMKDFVGAIKGTHQYPYSFKEDWRILKSLFALETGSSIVLTAN